jgi:hypothetical protein
MVPYQLTRCTGNLWSTHMSLTACRLLLLLCRQPALCECRSDEARSSALVQDLGYLQTYDSISRTSRILLRSLDCTYLVQGNSRPINRDSQPFFLPGSPYLPPAFGFLSREGLGLLESLERYRSVCLDRLLGSILASRRAGRRPGWGVSARRQEQRKI